MKCFKLANCWEQTLFYSCWTFNNQNHVRFLFVFPGSKYAYSNFGYIVLGRVIEQISGLSYGEFVQNMMRTIGITRMKLGKTFRHQADEDEVGALLPVYLLMLFVQEFKS